MKIINSPLIFVTSIFIEQNFFIRYAHNQGNRLNFFKINLSVVAGQNVLVVSLGVVVGEKGILEARQNALDEVVDF